MELPLSFDIQACGGRCRGILKRDAELSLPQLKRLWGGRALRHGQEDVMRSSHPGAGMQVLTGTGALAGAQREGMGIAGLTILPCL